MSYYLTSEVTHRNLNDGTIEGIRHKYLPVFSVQYHPEASPGPQESAYLFDEYIDIMRTNRGE
ncbi:MAG: Carbamoyl-phosphate synthase small chain [Desulfofundulus kuznetsovii]|nr:MAG: Carbamoyl-phosphate synthase small chain [Desulfotomaculum sp. 46_80]KUK85041.1 MAG: Carbamoyl-phosphate synthase small chain [Desulfofundulus kuznetsovii]